MKVVRTDEEVNDLRNQVAEGCDRGSKYPGMSYEEGMDTVLRWLLGETDDYPFEECASPQVTQN